MRNFAAFVLAFGLVLLPTLPRAQEETSPPPAPTWYAQALARGPGGLNVTHFWSKGANMRAETVIGGHRIVTIVRGDTYYTYDLNMGEGMAIKRAPAAMALDSPARRPFGNEAQALIRQGAERVREEDILGRKCDVYRITDQRGRREVWITRDGAPVPLRISIFHRKSGTEQFTDYLNWQTGLAVPDEFFVPDEGLALNRFDAYDAYIEKSTVEGPQGPVPVLYGDLLQGPPRAGWKN